MNPALAPAPPPAVNGTVRPAAAAAPPGVPPPKKHKQRMGQRADQDKVARDERGDDTGAADREEKDAKKPGNNKASATTTQYVDHTYTDFAIVGEDDLRLLDENSALLPNPASSMEASTREKLKGMSCTYGPMKKNAGGVVQPFPGKLLEVLYRSDLADSIVWMSHGRAFIVKKPKLFTTDVLPRFFKQTKFLSFTRQLNLWGFKRISRGLDAGCYYHELFLRGRPYLAMRMRRQKIKGTGMKLTPNPDKEPDFYNAWPVVPPLHERRVLPPLPPLPSERLSAGAPAGGAAGSLDRAGDALAAMPHPAGQDVKEGLAASAALVNSDAMARALSYGAAQAGGGASASAGAVASLLRQKDAAAAFPAFGGAAPSLRFPDPRLLPGGYPPGAAGPAGKYDDLLLAPGVGLLERQRAAAAARAGSARPGAAGAPGGLNPSDPIHGELSALLCGRSQQAMNAAAAMGAAAPGAAAAMGGVPYPAPALSSDSLLMERLRGLDRLKKEQEDMGMLLRARLFDDLGAAGGLGRAPGALGPGPFDRFPYPPPPSGAPGGPPGVAGGDAPPAKAAGVDPFPPGLGAAARPVEASVKDALREAQHLEELALAQRAKARSLALSGALHTHFGAPQMPTARAVAEAPQPMKARDLPPAPAAAPQRTWKPPQAPVPQTNGSKPGRSSSGGDDAVTGDGRPSFGRPFGRKD